MDEDYHKVYYQHHKDTYKERDKKWKLENKERWNAYQRKHKKLEYWRKKVADDPTNQKYILKLNSIINGS